MGSRTHNNVVSVSIRIISSEARWSVL